MKQKHQGYDAIAGIYDRLATLVFGNKLRKAETAHLNYISPKANILLVGGGTGRISEDITHLHPEGLTIDFVDISGEMIRLAKQRNTGANSVTFIHQSITAFSASNCYDIVITPFLLDNFSQPTAEKVFAILHQALKPNGYWLYTDFSVSTTHSVIQKGMLYVMYTFFRMACKIEAHKLPDVLSCFAFFHYQLVSHQTYLQHFIVSSAYQKPAVN